MKKYYFEGNPTEFTKIIIQESDEAKPLGLIVDLYERDDTGEDFECINSYTIWYDDLNIGKTRKGGGKK